MGLFSGCIIVQGQPTRKKIFSKILEMYFLLSEIVLDLLKECLCKLIRVDLFGVFSSKFRSQFFFFGGGGGNT